MLYLLSTEIKCKKLHEIYSNAVICNVDISRGFVISLQWHTCTNHLQCKTLKQKHTEIISSLHMVREDLPLNFLLVFSETLCTLFQCYKGRPFSIKEFKVILPCTFLNLFSSSVVWTFLFKVFWLHVQIAQPSRTEPFCVCMALITSSEKLTLFWKKLGTFW